MGSEATQAPRHAPLILVAAGLLLVLAGAALVASWEPRVTVETGTYTVPLQRLTLHPPGLVWFNETRPLGEESVVGDPGRGPLSVSLDLPPEPGDCNATRRLLDYGVEGVVDPGGTLRVSVEAVLEDGHRVVIDEGETVVQPPPGVGDYATATPIMAGNASGHVSLAQEGVEVALHTPKPLRVPEGARSVVLTVEYTGGGRLAAGLSAREVCGRAYMFDQPFLEPRPGYVEIPYTRAIHIDTGRLTLGIALALAGYPLLLLGLLLYRSPSR